jgi:hypothetical protein
MREASLAGIKLLSDRQPETLRVDDHPTGPPAIWLHDDPPQEAWIIVDVGERDWCGRSIGFPRVAAMEYRIATPTQPPPRLLLGWQRGHST